jgi:signal transduction histidine kinase
LIRLINELLDIEKLQAGKMDMHFDPLPLSYVIENSVQAVRGFAQLKELNIVTSQPDLEIYADGDRLVQVLVNLLSNAIKYAPRGSDVTIATTGEASFARISVSDRGQGVPDSYKETIFHSYEQVPGASVKQGSTGLGLAICKKIVEEHGGAIGVESRTGEGSTFWFSIPLSTNAVRDEPAQQGGNADATAPP